tara:strand:+ start:25602 stop:25754 length:153 start_codon:yes stop_codon:yes gene_type:complete
MDKHKHGETIVEGNHGRDRKTDAEKTEERREEKSRDKAGPIVEENDENDS